MVASGRQSAVGAPDWLAACAAQALALRAVIRYRRHREEAEFDGGVGVEEGLLSDLTSHLPSEFHLGELYRSFMGKWLPEAEDGGPAAPERYVELATTILADEITGAEGRCSDDLYHVIILLAALKPVLWNEAVKEMVEAERKAKLASNRSTTARGTDASLTASDSTSTR
jgi:hypothetical protein